MKAIRALFASILLLCCSVALAQLGNPVPLVDQPLVPTSAVPGGPAFTLSVSGGNFVKNSTVDWNGKALPTRFVSHTMLKAEIAAAQIATESTASITVVNPAPGGGTSNVVFFPVRASATSVQMQSQQLNVGTTDVAVADFNHDGKLDLAVVSGPDTVGVDILLGKRDGTFLSPVNYPTVSGPTSVVVGDFNGDGNLDLVLANGGVDSVSILLGNGDGTFRAAKDFKISISPVAGIAVGDFNRDGRLDLIVIGSALYVLLGNGDGTFKKPVQLSFRCCNSYSNPVVGDFNGDGILDIAANTNIGGGYGYVGVLLGNGDGTFQPPVVSLGLFGAETMVAADFNGDGKLDLVTDAYLGFSDVVVFLGNGDGTFSNRTVYLVPGGSFGLAVGDFNADGKLDVAVASNSGLGNSSYSLSVLLGNGDGTFQPFTSFAATSFVRGLAAGDFRGDGSLDLAVATDGGVEVYLQPENP
jgi:hypothetical protein